VSDSLVRFADLILAMTLGHRDAILQRWPEAAGKIQLIRQDGLDVADPIGGDVAEYEVCAAQLERHLSHWIGQLEPASLPVFRNAT